MCVENAWERDFLSVLSDPPCFLHIAVIDRTATFVANSSNPPQFEEKIRDGHRTDPKFSFLNPADPYHAYYRNKMDRVNRGELEQAEAKTAEGGDAAQADGAEIKVVDIGIEPPTPDFIVQMPNISSIDL